MYSLERERSCRSGFLDSGVLEKENCLCESEFVLFERASCDEFLNLGGVLESDKGVMGGEGY